MTELHVRSNLLLDCHTGLPSANDINQTCKLPARAFAESSYRDMLDTSLQDQSQ